MHNLRTSFIQIKSPLSASFFGSCQFIGFLSKGDIWAITSVSNAQHAVRMSNPFLKTLSVHITFPSNYTALIQHFTKSIFSAMKRNQRIFFSSVGEEQDKCLEVFLMPHGYLMKTTWLSPACSNTHLQPPDIRKCFPLPAFVVSTTTTVPTNPNNLPSQKIQ